MSVGSTPPRINNQRKVIECKHIHYSDYQSLDTTSELTQKHTIILNPTNAIVIASRDKVHFQERKKGMLWCENFQKGRYKNDQIKYGSVICDLVGKFRSKSNLLLRYLPHMQYTMQYYKHPLRYTNIKSCLKFKLKTNVSKKLSKWYTYLRETHSVFKNEQRCTHQLHPFIRTTV